MGGEIHGMGSLKVAIRFKVLLIRKCAGKFAARGVFDRKTIL